MAVERSGLIGISVAVDCAFFFTRILPLLGEDALLWLIFLDLNCI